MNESLIYRADALALVGLLFLLMLLAIAMGARMGIARTGKQEDNPGNSTIVGSMFGLLAFLLAFTFGMSASRYDARREALVNEANAIGTAMMRADLYPEEVRQAFRKDFKAYIEARIFYYDAGRDQHMITRAGQEADSLGKLLWNRATARAKTDSGFMAGMQMIPALNEMFDNAEIRSIREAARVPDSIVMMLFVLCVAGAFYAGYISAGKIRLDWFIIMGFCLLTSLVIFITLDLDRPRRGLIKLDGSQQAMLDLRKL